MIYMYNRVRGWTVPISRFLKYPRRKSKKKKRRKIRAMRDISIFLCFQVVAAHEPSKFPETRSKVSTVTQQPMEEQSPTSDGKVSLQIMACVL